MKTERAIISELSTGHFSGTRPDPTRQNVDPTRPAIADKKSDPTRLTPPICTMFHEFNIQVAERKQYTILLLHDFEGNSGNISLQVL